MIETNQFIKVETLFQPFHRNFVGKRKVFLKGWNSGNIWTYVPPGIFTPLIIGLSIVEEKKYKH